ncbi:hypothetical protein D9758_014305 [Tetrapyrgos nigripes]|uniref:Uncharacterized protein n=1 Tax=Tetrapyrgos nigripes TaxID=182062 RepID=A0A8H5CCF9_9AGAR|nr:hypothetical protein D9758_014305 [Tetrapyrgos nigripes]
MELTKMNNFVTIIASTWYSDADDDATPALAPFNFHQDSVTSFSISEPPPSESKFRDCVIVGNREELGVVEMLVDVSDEEG